MQVAELILKYLQTLAWPLIVIGLAIGFRKHLRPLFTRITSAEGPGGFRATFAEQVAAARAAIDDSSDEVGDEEENSPSTRSEEDSPSTSNEEEGSLEGPKGRRVRIVRAGCDLSHFNVSTREQLLQVAREARSGFRQGYFSGRFTGRPLSRSNVSSAKIAWRQINAAIRQGFRRFITIEWRADDPSVAAQASLDAFHALTGISAIARAADSYRALATAYQNMPSRLSKEEAESFVESVEALNRELLMILGDLRIHLEQVHLAQGVMKMVDLLDSDEMTD